MNRLALFLFISFFAVKNSYAIECTNFSGSWKGACQSATLGTIILNLDIKQFGCEIFKVSNSGATDTLLVGDFSHSLTHNTNEIESTVKHTSWVGAQKTELQSRHSIHVTSTKEENSLKDSISDSTTTYSLYENKILLVNVITKYKNEVSSDWKNESSRCALNRK